MPILPPAVIIILAIAAALIFIRFAKKLFFHWAILLILEMILLVLWPKGMEIIANFIAVFRAILYK